MWETLHCSNGKDETRIRRAFGWVVTFRDFPAGSWQHVNGNEMMREALTFFTKGRAEFYLDGQRRGDRVPGILSSEHEIVGEGGTFELRYIEPTTRVCIPRKIQIRVGRLPSVSQLDLKKGDTVQLSKGYKALICLGRVRIGTKVFDEEKTFKVETDTIIMEALDDRVLLLDFTNA